MLTNKERAWINKNKDIILLMSNIQKKGVDVEAIFDTITDLIKLHDRSKKANFDLVALTGFVVEQRSAEGLEAGRSYFNA